MAYIEVLRVVLVTTGEYVVGMLLTSVEAAMFSLDMDRVFVEGDIMRNKFDGLVGCK